MVVTSCVWGVGVVSLDIMSLIGKASASCFRWECSHSLTIDRFEQLTRAGASPGIGQLQQIRINDLMNDLRVGRRARHRVFSSQAYSLTAVNRPRPTPRCGPQNVTVTKQTSAQVYSCNPIRARLRGDCGGRARWAQPTRRLDELRVAVDMAKPRSKRSPRNALAPHENWATPAVSVQSPHE